MPRVPAFRSRRWALYALLVGCMNPALVDAATDPDFAPVTAGTAVSFPPDAGAHPAFRTEWWYVTGWLRSPQGEELGFQVTFFRSKLPSHAFGNNPSAFAAGQILAAHVALSDPAHGRLWLDQRTARAAFGLAGFEANETRVWIDRWILEHRSPGYSTRIEAHDFSLQLQMASTQPAMLNGARGFSRKAPDPQSASYYYSLPHLAVSGRVFRSHRWTTVRGEAWLDHEWSSEYLARDAVGWQWVGLNLADGSAVMAFSIRGKNGESLWSGATVRDASLASETFGPGQVRFEPTFTWRSPATAIAYPVAVELVVGARHFDLAPLMNDQESDTRLSTGSVYWEGAVRAAEDHRAVGRGYLELTGFGEPLKLK
jgi:predicted secreted hydrolase